MMVPQYILKFIENQTDLYMGYSEIVFFKPHDIAELQIGYRYDNAGKSLVNHVNGSWNDKWTVIATDQSGDPIFVDSGCSQSTIYAAAHGEGSWKPHVISDSLLEFEEIIKLLQKMSIHRVNPTELKENPVNDKDKSDFFKYVILRNPNSELWYWEQFFE